VDADLRRRRGHVQAQRGEHVVAEEPAVVAGLPGPGAQRELQVGERAVRAGEVHHQHRQRDRRVHQGEPRPTQRDQRAGQHHQHDDAVQHGHRVREEPHEHQRGTSTPSSEEHS
jgi:hypothetical protein